MSALGLFRSPTQQPFSAKDRRWLERITPHVLRASRLHLQFESLRSQVAVGWHASSSLDYPIMIAAENGQVLFANLAAEALFAMPQTPLKCRQGRVTASMPSTQGKLSAAIRAACSPTGGRGEVLLLQSDLAAPGYQVVVLPLPRSTPTSVPLGHPLALITMGSTRTGSGVDAELLQQLFGLSAAEARVVTGIAAGSSLAQLAEAAQVSINTMRTQLQTAFSKTGTHRQTELVNLVNALPRLRR